MDPRHRMSEIPIVLQTADEYATAPLASYVERIVLKSNRWVAFLDAGEIDWMCTCMPAYALAESALMKVLNAVGVEHRQEVLEVLEHPESRLSSRKEQA
jgi:hypothetical protein